MRLSDDPDLASDLAQEAFIRLYRRGAPPDTPGPWLVTVATNLFRNARNATKRRRELLTPVRAGHVLAERSVPTDRALGDAETRDRVRAALDRLPERDRQLLLLRAEGYRYRELAVALELNEASVGTLLARAKAAFKQAYEEAFDAP